MNWTSFIVFVALFALVSVMGFLASRWRRGDLGLIAEWCLAGRRLGTLVTWFLLGGDLYTAYTFVAVPALVFGAGANRVARRSTASGVAAGLQGPLSVAGAAHFKAVSSTSW